MKQPGKKGSYSTWVSFKADLPANIVIDWKVKQAIVDLSFWKEAAHRPGEAGDLSSLPAAAKIEAVSEGALVIRIPVMEPPPNWADTSSEVIEAALGACQLLLQYYKAHRGSFS